MKTASQQRHMTLDILLADIDQYIQELGVVLKARKAQGATIVQNLDILERIDNLYNARDLILKDGNR